MAFAAVISLKHTMERLKKSQIPKSAYEQLELLEKSLKRLDGSSNSSINRSKINALDAEIREAVCKVEDVVEFYVLYQFPPPSDTLGDEGFPQIPHVDEEGMKQAMESFLNTVKKLGERYMKVLNNPFPEEEEDDHTAPPEEKSTMIGLLEQFEKIRNDLLDFEPGLKMVSLFGMAGIGKTVVGREIYDHPIVHQDFDIRVWVTIGPKQLIKNVLVDILYQIEGKPTILYKEEDKDTLGDRIHRSLYGRKYCIVLDDVWKTSILDYLKRFFPVEKKGSRVLVTTRQEEMAKYVTTSSVYQIRFLNKEESWNLLCHRVFGDKPFPPELEKVGRKIAEICEGLPLLILAVADLLSGLERTEECWKKVADKKTTTFTDAYDNISEVLVSSYEYLPQYLKACFLYMGVFPNSEVPRSKLVDLWIVEDFLEPNLSQNLEIFAVECLRKLVSHSLVILCKDSSTDNGIKSCKLHSAYWHLCVKVARKNKFLHVLKKFMDGVQEHIESQRRLAVQNNILFGIKQVFDSMAAATLTVRSLLCTGPDHQYPVPVCFNLLLLKVLDALAIRFYEFPEEVLKLIQLRYLALTHNGNLSSSISVLGNLQCLIIRKHHNIKFIRDLASLPREIWDLQELRHLRIMGSNLPGPSNGAKLMNLLTLYVNAKSCTEGVFKSTPHLRKLEIKIELEPIAGEIAISCFEHISILDELESLKCVVVNHHLRCQVVAPPDCYSSTFSCGLKKLSLNGFGYSSEYMRAVGLLPNLQVLKLRCSAFQDPEWITSAEEFPRLKYLLLEDIDLVQWKTNDDDCFPCLVRLFIQHCYRLKEIPSQIGAILTLKTIEVVDSPSVVTSALKIQEEERYYGNFSLQVVITSSWNL